MTVVRTTWAQERTMKADDSESVTCYGIQVKNPDSNVVSTELSQVPLHLHINVFQPLCLA